MEPEQRQAIILQLLDTAPEIDALTVMNVLNTDTSTVTSDFKALIASGEMVQSSPGKYRRPFDVRKYLEQPLNMREEREYKQELLEEYDPKQTTLLWKETLKKLSNYQGNTWYSYRENLEFLEKFYLEFSYHSNRLAGWELDERDSEVIMKFWVSPKWKAFFHSQRILNYKKVLDTLIQDPGDIVYSVLDFQKIHKMIMYEKIATSLEGTLRDFDLVIPNTTYKPLKDERDLENQLDLFTTKLQKIESPFEKSFFIFVFLPYILPFSEGNKELSRIMMNIPLIQLNSPAIRFSHTEAYEYEIAYRALYELGDINLLKQIFIKEFWE